MRLLALLVGTTLIACAQSAPQPKAEEAISAVANALTRYPVVAIAESPHGLREAGEFYDALVRDARFNSKVNDIVVEFGSRSCQSIVDRYIAGENVPEEELQHVWRDSTKVMSWESPIYAGLLTSVRQTNRSLPPNRRLRVLVGDSPIDWLKVQKHEDWEATQPNNNSFSSVIIHDVLDRHRKALVILGSNHLTKGGDAWGDPDTTTMVEDKYPGSMYVILMLYRQLSEGDQERLEASDWKPPVIVALRGIWLDALPISGLTMGKVADAVLYLGPRQSLQMTRLTPDPTSFDDTYKKEIARRYKIVYGCEVDISKLGSGMRPCR